MTVRKNTLVVGVIGGRLLLFQLLAIYQRSSLHHPLT